MIRFFKTQLYYRKLKEIMHLQNRISHGAINYEKARSYGLLVNADDDKSLPKILAFGKKLEADQKVVSYIGICKNAKAIGEISFPIFDNSTLNFHLFPKDDDVDNFIEKRFDILINCSLKIIPALDYIATMSQAFFRIGSYEKQHEHAYDLMLNLKDNDELDEYLEQCIHFLKTLKIS